MIGQYYQPEDYNTVNLPEGDYLAKITGASEEYAKSSGNPMAVLTLIVKEAPQITFKYRIVEGEYFNKNMTRMFDCFKIRRGEFNMRTWIGKTGYVHIAKGKPNDEGKQFLEVKTLVVPPTTGQQQVATQPTQQRPPVQNMNAQPSYTQPRNAAPVQQQSFSYGPEQDGYQDDYTPEANTFPEEIPF